MFWYFGVFFCLWGLFKWTRLQRCERVRPVAGNQVSSEQLTCQQATKSWTTKCSRYSQRNIVIPLNAGVPLRNALKNPHQSAVCFLDMTFGTSVEIQRLIWSASAPIVTDLCLHLSKNTPRTGFIWTRPKCISPTELFRLLSLSLLPLCTVFRDLQVSTVLLSVR